jgi:hypothetical protein
VKKMLAALGGLAVLLGAGLAILFGLFSDGNGEQMSGEALAVGLYQEDPSGSLTCDDMKEIVNPSSIESLPAVVAVVEAEDVGFRIEIPNRNVASLMLARAKAGRPFADEKAALNDIEDGYLLYIGILRKARRGEPGVVVSEDEAREYLENHSQGTCESGALVRPKGVTDSQMVRAIQIDQTTTRFIQELINSNVPAGSIRNVDQAIADMVSGARTTVKITEVGLSATGGLECTQGGAKVSCPAGLPAP